MWNLLYKELRLAAHPSIYVFILLGALVLIPAYPYGVVFFFGTLGIFQSFMFDRETRDIFYTVLLPVRKQDAVRGKVLLMIFAQLAQLAFSLPFAVLRTALLPEGNPAGIEANVAYYGFGGMMYGVFNWIFLTQFYKTASQVGKSFLIALIPVVLGIVLMESAVHFPGMAWLDSTAAADLIRQIPILAVGFVAYISGTLLGYRGAVRRFAQVNL